MKLYELVKGNSAPEPLVKLSAEQHDYIIKRADEILSNNLTVMEFSENIAKIAAEEIEKMDFSEPGLQKTAQELLAYGQGLADGEMLTKQAMVPIVYEDAYGVFIQKIAEVMGPEAAQQVDGALREAGGKEQAQADQVEAVHAEVAENVAQAIVEQAGGIEAVQQDPELSQDIINQANAVADQIVQENMAGQ